MHTGDVVGAFSRIHNKKVLCPSSPAYGGEVSRTRAWRVALQVVQPVCALGDTLWTSAVRACAAGHERRADEHVARRPQEPQGGG